MSFKIYTTTLILSFVTSSVYPQSKTCHTVTVWTRVCWMCSSNKKSQSQSSILLTECPPRLPQWCPRLKLVFYTNCLSSVLNSKNRDRRILYHKKNSNCCNTTTTTESYYAAATHLSPENFRAVTYHQIHHTFIVDPNSSCLLQPEN